MVSFFFPRFFVLLLVPFTAALLLFSSSAWGLTNPSSSSSSASSSTPHHSYGHGYGFSRAEMVALSQGEASLLGGSSTEMYNGQPLWSGKKNKHNNNNSNSNNNNKEKPNGEKGSFTSATTPSNQSSFVRKSL